MLAGIGVYSLRRLVTGLATAALMDWKLTVKNAISIEAKPASANIHHWMLMR